MITRIYYLLGLSYGAQVSPIRRWSFEKGAEGMSAGNARRGGDSFTPGGRAAWHLQKLRTTNFGSGSEGRWHLGDIIPKVRWDILDLYQFN